MRDNSYTDCYVAFIDILGFKNLVRTKSCQQIMKIHESYIQLISDIVYKDQTGKIQTVNELECVKYKVMSDSICFYIESNTYNALFCLLSTCAVLQRTLLELDDPVLIRGAIAKGNLFATDDNILFGPAMVEAYLSEEDAEFPRIIISKRTLELGKMYISPKEVLLPWFEKLIFCDFDDLYSVDFINYEDWTLQKKQKVTNFVESALDTTTDKRIRAKYLYLHRRLTQEVHKEENNA